jgi:hypothetical protein
MNEAVYQALRRQEQATRKLSAFVFCNLKASGWSTSMSPSGSGIPCCGISA